VPFFDFSDVFAGMCLYGVCKRDGNNNLASDMYGAHVIFVHDNVMERCGEKRANR